MEHSFNVQFAQKYGIEEAIIVHNFYFWLRKNIANEKHLHNGRYWTYNSNNAFTKLFPYINKTKIFRVLKHLEECDIILKDNFNTNVWDKTLWYSFSDHGLYELYAFGYDVTDFGKMNHRDNQSETTIPYSKQTDSITDNKEKEDNKLSSKKKASNTAWRASFVEYKVLVETAKEELLNDEEYKYKFISMYPNADFYRTVLKSMDYWCSEQGWNTKKKSKSKEINMLATLKKNLDKSVVYKNHNDEPIENLRKLSIEYTDKKEGTLADGTIIKGAYRYYFSNRDGRAYSIPIEAPPMPNDRCEFDIKTNSWQMPKENETLSDNIW